MKKFVAFITLKDGRRIYAKNYGIKAFCIDVDENQQDRPKTEAK